MASVSLIALFKSGKGVKSDDIVKAVTSNAKLAAEVDADTGNTALHFACCNGAPLAVVKALLKANASAAQARDADGNVPVVGAVANGASVDVIKALLQAYPDAAKSLQGTHTLLHLRAGQT